MTTAEWTTGPLPREPKGPERIVWVCATWNDSDFDEPSLAYWDDYHEVWRVSGFREGLEPGEINRWAPVYFEVPDLPLPECPDLSALGTGAVVRADLGEDSNPGPRVLVRLPGGKDNDLWADSGGCYFNSAEISGSHRAGSPVEVVHTGASRM